MKYVKLVRANLLKLRPNFGAPNIEKSSTFITPERKQMAKDFVEFVMDTLYMYKYKKS